MSTTIDSLQIEIQSNSSNAASSINDLAKALNKLNKNGDVSTAVTNLNNLRKSLHAFANIPSSASKIDSLANSLKSLKKIGTINLGASIGGIKTAMESLKNINVDGVAPQIEKIAGALSPLNNIKGSGFNAMMNGFKKLNDVVDVMDSATIDKFVAKIKELDEKLGPVSTKLVAIGNAFKGVNSKALEASGGMSVFGGKVNTTTLNLQSMIHVAQNVRAALQPIINLLKNTISQAIEWDGIEYQFGNVFGEQADIYYDKIVEITDALKINKQMFMENSAMAASMLIGFGVDRADAREMGLGYTELAYDIWAAFNNVYKSFDGADGAMAAVRSAIAGEVEPIRRAGFTIVDSQLKITAANHGLAYSSDKATEAQKSYLRYLTLVDQAASKGIIGTYASEMDKAEGMMRTFRQQLSSLAQTFGSLFLPILVKVMPWLQAFVDLLGDAVIAIANFFGVDIQKVDFSDSFSGLESSSDSATESINGTTGALKKLKNATLGFDELNIISPQDKNGSGGGDPNNEGYEGLDISSIWDKSIYDSIQDQTDKIKQKIKDMLPTIGLLGTALAGLSVANLLTGIDNATSKMKGLSKGLNVASIAIAVGAIVWDLTGAYLESGNWLTWLATLGTTAIGTGLAYKFGGKGGAGFTLLVSGVAMLSRLVFELKEGTVDFSDTETFVTMLTGGIETVIGGVFTWKVLGPAIKKAFAALSTKISAWLAAGGATALFAKIETALMSIPVWGWIAAAVVALIVGAFVAFKNWDKITKFFTETVPNWFSGVKEAVSKWWNNIDIGGTIRKAMGDSKEWFSGVRDNVLAFWDDLIKKIDNIDWANLGYNVGKKVGIAFKNAGQWFTDVGVAFKKFWKEDIPKFFKETAPKTIEKISQDWNRFWKEKVPEFFSKLVNFFTVELPTWKDDMAEIGKEIIFGVSDGIDGSWKEFWKGVKEWIDGFVKGFKDALGIKTNSTVFERFGRNIVDGLKSGMPNNSLLEKLSSIWNNAKNWWDTKGNLKTYTPSIGNIKDALVAAWNSAKTWWNDNVKLSIPSLSFKVTYSTEGLSTVKKAIVNALGLQGWPKLSFAASGGIFDMGSLVWAGESGPEIVANAGGGKTGVMNVQQMSDAVYEGVYSAVVAAMRASGNGENTQAVNVYLDGKQITATVEKRQRERGATLMTGGMAYGY